MNQTRISNDGATAVDTGWGGGMVLVVVLIIILFVALFGGNNGILGGRGNVDYLSNIQGNYISNQLAEQVSNRELKSIYDQNQNQSKFDLILANQNNAELKALAAENNKLLQENNTLILKNYIDGKFSTSEALSTAQFNVLQREIDKKPDAPRQSALVCSPCTVSNFNRPDNFPNFSA